MNNKTIVKSNYSMVDLYVTNQGFRQNSIKLYRNILRKYFRFCLKLGISVFDMTREDIIKFIESPIKMKDGSENEKKKKTKRIHKGVIKGFYDWSITKSRILANPISSYKIKSGGQKQTKRVITDQDFQNMLNQSQELKTTTIISLLWYTGIRSIELRELKVRDIKLNENYIEINYSKTTMGYRKIPIHPKFRDLLKLYLNIRTTKVSDEPYLFLSNRNSIYSDRAILHIVTRLQDNLDTNFSSHDFRRAYITRVYNKTNDIVMCQKLAGHESIETTQKYIINNEKEMFETFNSLDF